MRVDIYTDGACSGNPGPGGWGAILIAKKNEKVISEKEIYGGEQNTTNNRMELIAAINGLNALIKSSTVTVITDSKYLKDGVTKWLSQWTRNDWKNSKRQEIKNVDLWKQIYYLCQKHQVSWMWVKGHNNHEKNEKADYLARLGMKDFKN